MLLLHYSFFFLGKFLTKPETKTKIVEVTKTVEVIKEVKVENKNVKTVVKEKVNVDGSKEIITEIVDLTKTETKTEQTKEIASQKRTIKDSSKYLTIGVLATKSLNEPFTSELDYAIVVKKSIYKNLGVQVLGSTNKTVGLGLSWDF